MKHGIIVSLTAVTLTLVGCISAERKAEYAEWQASDDGVPTVMLGEFESKYRQGWRKRAEEKKKARLEREEAARVLESRLREYTRWLASDDKEYCPSLEVFEQKYKDGWEARAAQKKQARLEREEMARRAEEMARRIESYWKAFDEGDYRCAIRNYDNTSHGYYKDWLRDWIGPRIPKTEEEIAIGNAVLEDFGAEFMPNAYRQYEEAMRTAQEIQRVFNENFPEPSKIRRSDARWNAFDKMVKGLSKARTEYFRQRDQLCHFYLLHWAKSITAEELKKVDAMKIYIRLMEAVPRWEDASVTNKYNLIYCFQKQTEVESLSNSCVEFAKEHMPKTLAQRRNLIERCKQCYSDYFAIRQQCRQIDCCRIELPVVAITEKLLFVTKMLNENFNSITELQTEFVTLEKDAETVAKIDGEMAERLRRFDENLKEWVKNRSNGPLFAVNSAMNAFFPCDYVHPWHLLAARGDKKSYSFMLYHHFDLFARIRGAGVLSCSIDSEELESKFVDIDPTTKYDIHCNNDTGDYQVRIVSR